MRNRAISTSNGLETPASLPGKLRRRESDFCCHFLEVPLPPVHPSIDNKRTASPGVCHNSRKFAIFGDWTASRKRISFKFVQAEYLNCLLTIGSSIISRRQLNVECSLHMTNLFFPCISYFNS
ncbi:uncharacterized protein LOC111782103 [Cucurbita pepo subsp. pepo]|uniref:uncharacterized protein LOC111782103 n=1 Tax=Cucurbita pepo subsp. pepo TaxID=3664 RepID=UPI000C9DA6CC|nr:uncharacterized protein LOC111782103 [Cucurbita pepo subsp. pepo]